MEFDSDDLSLLLAALASVRNYLRSDEAGLTSSEIAAGEKKFFLLELLFRNRVNPIRSSIILDAVDVLNLYVSLMDDLPLTPALSQARNRACKLSARLLSSLPPDSRAGR